MKLVWIVCGIVFLNGTLGDKLCAVRIIPGQSVVCVCNSTYCDEIEREAPQNNTFVSYTSSKSGLRLKKTIGEWNINNKTRSHVIIRLDPSTRYQEIEGFGGAVTDAAGINWKSLPEKLREKLINSYFSEQGLQYNMIRVPIGGSDFSTHPYAYNELPENDTQLSNFTLTPEDFDYKIPMIKAAMSASKTTMHVVATTWSPPLWMKTKRTYGGFSRLKRDFFHTYALYYLKFLQKYEENGIEVWGISTTNEPTNGVFGLANFNSLGWSVKDMAEWITTHLGPMIRNSTYKDIKIMACDDQRYTIPLWYNTMIRENPKVLDYIDGYAVHYYADNIISASVFDLITKTHPKKFILATEACEGSYPWQYPKVLPGSWQRAKTYILDILQDLNYNVVGWIDWNLCLDSKGGPNWAKNFVDSPIIVYPDDQEFIKQPMYYALAHLSAFVPRGSTRIRVSEAHSLSSALYRVAFVTPRKTIVVVIYNNGGDQTVSINFDQKQAHLELLAESITTVELPYD